MLTKLQWGVTGDLTTAKLQWGIFDGSSPCSLELMARQIREQSRGRVPRGLGGLVEAQLWEPMREHICLLLTNPILLALRERM